VKLLVGITGASGSIYAERFLNFALLSEEISSVSVVFSKTGAQVCAFESSHEPETSILRRLLARTELPQKIQRLAHDDLFCRPASGSSSPDAMLVIPCSMGTLGRVAGGFSTNLIERSADVMIKENKRLVICPRETPLSAIHLENMLKLSRLGVRIVPAMPGFYQKPKTLDDIIGFVAGKCAESLGLKHDLYTPWSGGSI
jgi:4-hydroxy-3-polyprenylbenzoate decarboxylase